VLAEKSTADVSGAPDERVPLTISDPAALAAMRDGNRIVVTATQHIPLTQPPAVAAAPRAYVAVKEVQPGPKRGRVGSVNCSAREIGVRAGLPGLQFCDLVGALLTSVQLGGLDARMADLTGGDLRGAGLKSFKLDGGRAGGVDASGAVFSSGIHGQPDGATMIAATAPGFTARSTLIDEPSFFSSSMNRADFTGSTISGVSFGGVALNGARFSGTTLLHVDFGVSQLVGAKVDHINASVTSLFFADLTRATLLGSSFTTEESREDPLRFAILCRTQSYGGRLINRDCPRAG